MKAQKDANHDAIVTALLNAGFKVEETWRFGDSFPDLMIGAHGKIALLEVKDGAKVTSAKVLRPGQKAFFERWQGYPVRVVYTPADAVQTAGELLGPPPRHKPDETLQERFKRLATSATRAGGGT